MRFGWFLILVLTMARIAGAAPSIHVNRVEGNKQRTNFRAESTVEWKWTTNDEQVTTLSADVTLKSPEFAKYKQVKTLSPTTKVKLNGDKLTLEMVGQSELMMLRHDQHKLILEVLMKPEGRVLDENCKGYSLAMRSEEDDLPFYVGIHCSRSASGLGMAITFPKEVEFDNSSLFESKGKGEHWRFYELGKVKAVGAEVGRITLSYKKKQYEFVIESLKVETTITPEEENNRITFVGGAGLGMLAINGPDITASDAKPALKLKVPHYSFWKGLGVGVDADIAIPLTQGTNSISYFQMEFFASYEFMLGKMFAFRPKAGYVIVSQVHQSTQIGLSANELTVGLAAEMLLGPNSRISIGFTKCGFGSQYTRSHYALDAGFLYKQKAKIGYGAGFRLQSFGTISDLGIERSFNLTGFYGLIAF